MNKITLLFSIMLLSIMAYGQSAKQMLNEIEGKWELDDNGNVTFVVSGRASTSCGIR